MDKTSPMKSKPLVDVTCKLGTKGCFKDGRCHALANCENKIVTNADRIRAMSDEELAKLFCGFCKNAKICEGCPMCDGKCAESELAESWVEWLKQPAEDQQHKHIPDGDKN